MIFVKQPALPGHSQLSWAGRLKLKLHSAPTILGYSILTQLLNAHLTARQDPQSKVKLCKFSVKCHPSHNLPGVNTPTY